ncbi:nuclear transport factor 2 family protein [Desulfopila aestuarii]|uniref:SnoaL-like domain-containing protein n=1 Tax=Desulfopila aestuarii DSM 18488 TaxID=1121416 RepID=A0A1M7YLD8_9BACT|nr:nuclear transport factor 2 family protein [Desulfopila aestuarii]SHO53407.1 hypothetical protein SAMN02745220_05101 [Desulfopila aestuarii DSM 18488]
MDSEHNKEKVREFFQRFVAADVQGALSLLDESVVWRAMGRDGGLPMSGEMDKAAIADLIVAVKDAFPDSMNLTPIGWTAEGGRVAVEMESFGIKGNGTVYNNLYHFLVIMKEGKIALVKEYMDTCHVKKVFVDEN